MMSLSHDVGRLRLVMPCYTPQRARYGKAAISNYIYSFIRSSPICELQLMQSSEWHQELTCCTLHHHCFQHTAGGVPGPALYLRTQSTVEPCIESLSASQSILL